MSAVALSWRSGRSPTLGVMLATRERPRSGQISPEFDHLVMRHDDEAIELFVARIGEREDRPVVAALARAHFDAPDDAVGTGRGRHLDAVAFGLLLLDRFGQIDRRRVAPDIDRLHGLRGRHSSGGQQEQSCREYGAQTQSLNLQPGAPAGEQRAVKGPCGDSKMGHRRLRW